MGYEGGDLLLTGVAWPTSGFLPMACVCRLRAVAWVVGQLSLVTLQRIRGGW